MMDPEVAEAEYNTACGEIIREWARFEGVLFGYFEIFLGNPDQFRARVAWATLPNLQARRKVLNRYAENYLEGEPLRCFRILMKRMSKLANRRNSIAHASSGYDRENGKILFLHFDQEREDGTFMFLNQKWEHLNNIKGWAGAIKRLSNDMVLFMPTVQQSAAAWSKMHRELQDGRGQNSDPHPPVSSSARPAPQPES
jgi:hypothetical protein